jgi:hypothetical protein
LKACIPLLQGLLDQPEGEPVGIVVSSSHQQVQWAAGIDVKALDGTKLYTHSAPRKPITKADITNEMTKAMQTALFTDGVDDKDIMVFAVNAYLMEKL